MRLDVAARTLRFREPLTMAFGELRDRELFEVTLTGDDGVSGHGEAAPLEVYDGTTLEEVRSALESHAWVLADAGERTPPELLAACREAADVPHALAAIDIALWDRAGRREGRPLARLLAGGPLEHVPVNATIAALDRAGAAEAAAEAARAGFTCVKVKVGVGDDAGRVAAVRAAAGPEMALRLDANGAWTVEEAVRSIDALAPAGLELVEEPVHGIAATREVRERVAARVAIDETSVEPGALGAGVADAVCFKIGRSGGISALLAQATLARTAGMDVYIATAFDGPLGVAAALHAAAALRVEIPCGLATLRLFEDVGDRLPVRDGRMAVPEGPGLGLL